MIVIVGILKQARRLHAPPARRHLAPVATRSNTLLATRDSRLATGDLQPRVQVLNSRLLLPILYATVGFVLSGAGPHEQQQQQQQATTATATTIVAATSLDKYADAVTFESKRESIYASCRAREREAETVCSLQHGKCAIISLNVL